MFNTSVDSIQYSPLIVINGVPYDTPRILTDEYTRDVLSILNEDSIRQIAIIDKLSEEWTLFCKPFSGVILLSVDRRTEKKLFKVKLK